eukprot:UN04829
MFAVEYSDVIPDILVMAKGIASGYPLSALATRDEISAKQIPGSMGGTFGGNAVSCAAAIATIDTFHEESILKNVQERSKQLIKSLKEMKNNNLIDEIRT